MKEFLELESAVRLQLTSKHQPYHADLNLIALAPGKEGITLFTGEQCPNNFWISGIDDKVKTIKLPILIVRKSYR